MAKQNQTKGGKDNGSSAKKQLTVAKAETSEKAKKQKTPAGHFRFNGKIYPLETKGMPAEKLYCKSCGVENAKVLGSFRDEDCTTYYVVKCPHHPDNVRALSEEKFRYAYPGILPNNLPYPTPEGYPVQNSYCKCQRATTAAIIGESPSGIAWKVECSLCGATWFENKERFAAKYIGVDGNPPLYPQREPQPLKEWSDPKQDINLTALFVPAKKIAGPNDPKLEAKSKEEKVIEEDLSNVNSCRSCQESHCDTSDHGNKQEASSALGKETSTTANPHSMQIQLCGVTLVLPEGAVANVKYVDGKPIIELI